MRKASGGQPQPLSVRWKSSHEDFEWLVETLIARPETHGPIPPPEAAHLAPPLCLRLASSLLVAMSALAIRAIYLNR